MLIIKNRMRGARLRGVSIPKADLSGVNAEGVDMHRSMLSRAKLERFIGRQGNFDLCHMAAVKADNSDFSGASLRRAKMLKGSFKGANFKDADLSYADFRCADITDANFDGADITGTLFHGCIGVTKKTFKNIRNRNELQK